MPTTLDGHDLQADIEGEEMPAVAEARLVQEGRGQKPTKPGRVLQEGEIIPGIKRQHGLKHWRHVVDFC
jgi:hypothetical protein